MTTYGWLKDQSKYDEVIQWLGGRWDIEGPQGLAAWCKGRFGLDELKEWIEGKYTIDEAILWEYHESENISKRVIESIEAYKPALEANESSLRLLGINRNLGMGGLRDVHVVFEGDQEIFKHFTETLVDSIAPVRDVVNFSTESAIARTPSEETTVWLAGRWDIDQLQAWADERFTLDQLKEWIDGAYTIDEVVLWRYHKSDTTVASTIIAIETYRPGIEKDGGTINFIGIDPNGVVHIALDGACGSCTFRETGTLKSMSEFITENVPGARGLINDGPRRAALGDFSVEDYSVIQGTPVQISSIGRSLTPPTSNP